MKPTPNIRRRRLLAILSLVLLAVGVGYYCTRPKIDARLVGKWKSSSPISLGSGFIFYPDEQGEAVSFGYFGKSTPFSWRVRNRRSGDELELRWQLGPPFGSTFLEQLDSSIYAALHPAITRYHLTYGPKEITIEGMNSALLEPSETLKRVPD